MNERRHVAFHLATILATPFLLLAVHPNLFVNPVTNGGIDNWVYTGFFQSLPTHLERWGNTYYATRLSWLLPGYAAHQLFPPLVANYVLHIGFFYVLLFSIYSLTASGLNRTMAFVVTMLVAWNPELLASMSWDYVDGAVITYFTVTLLCFEKAASGTRRWLWAVAAGAGLTCLASANLVGATLWPVCGVFLVLRVGVVRWRATVAIAALAAVGAAATFALFGLANRQLGGPFIYLTPSVDYASSRLWLPSPWDVKGLAWLGDTPHLILPAVAMFAALLALAAPRQILKSFSGIVQVTFLTAGAWWVVHSVLWTHSIHISYYVSYLIPLGLLALAAHPDSPLTTVSPRHAVALELAVLGLLAVHLRVFGQGDVVWRFVEPVVIDGLLTPFGLNALAAFGLACLALVSMKFIRTSWCRWPAFLVSLLMVYTSVATNWAAPDTPQVREDYALSVAAHRFIAQHLDPNRSLRFWYAMVPYEPRPYRNISSTYLWGWSLVNEAMPSLDAVQGAPLDGGAQVVLLAANQGEIDAAQQALRKSGWDYTSQARREFGQRGTRFWVIIGGLSRVAAADK